VESWPATELPSRGAFTSIATWRGPFGPLDFDGRRYGLRVHEFRRFMEVPARSGARFELALSIDAADERDRQVLLAAGWQIADPREAARDIAAYHGYVNRSAAEFGVARNMYVDTRGGWFSDRSACYLAAGRPVLAQDTGFGSALPVGDGLLAFSSLDEAVAGVEDIVAHTDRHAAAAREIAEAHLDAPKVVGALLAELGG
jgi:hypothetical protein